MSHTYDEITSQYEALQKSFDKVLSLRDLIAAEYAKCADGTLYLGCGSSYSLCKSAEMMHTLYGMGTAAAFAAGDMLVNFERYKAAAQNALVVIFSRSGATSEAVRAAELLKRECACRILSVVLCGDSPLKQLSDLCIELPWAYDLSVCQTRSVSALYLSALLMTAIAAGDEKSICDARDFILSGEVFLRGIEPMLKDLAQADYSDAVVLSDGAPRGAADEGSLAFCEIARMFSKHYHVLDVRHGPMVLIGQKTLVIALTGDVSSPLYDALEKELCARAGRLITVGAREAADTPHIAVKAGYSHAVYGLPLLNVCQLTAYYNALFHGYDPDNPPDLEPWIKL